MWQQKHIVQIRVCCCTPRTSKWPRCLEYHHFKQFWQHSSECTWLLWWEFRQIFRQVKFIRKRNNFDKVASKVHQEKRDVQFPKVSWEIRPSSSATRPVMPRWIGHNDGASKAVPRSPYLHNKKSFMLRHYTVTTRSQFLSLFLLMCRATYWCYITVFFITRPFYLHT